MKHISLYITIFSIMFHLPDVLAQAPNSWTQKANVGVRTRWIAVGFSIGAKGYIGTGQDTVTNYSRDFWEYDTAINTWTQKANFGGTARVYAGGFSIGAFGYLGTGWDGNNRYDFWKYNPSSNSWVQIDDFGGGGRLEAVGFSIGNKGYFGTGWAQPPGGGVYNDFWEYDPSTNVWTQKANFGGTPRFGAVGFSIGSKGYLGTGSNGPLKRDFWEYDPTSNTWTQKTDFGGTARKIAVGFSIGTKGYIGTGLDASGQEKDFWEYDPSSDTWTRKADLAGYARWGAVGFSIGNRGFIGTGSSNNVGGSSFLNDFWEYTPGCSVPVPPSNITPSSNQNICSGNSTSLTVSGTGSIGWYSAATGGTWLGGGSTFITPVLTTNITYYAQDSTICGPSSTRTAISVIVNPLPVPTITGQTSMCVNSGYYYYLTEPGMQNYVWTVSSGGSINYGSGTNQIQVTWIGAGAQTVSVNYSNSAGCHAAAPAVLIVTVNPLPGQAGQVTGTATVCAGTNGVTYLVAPIQNTTYYVWTLLPNSVIASGAGSNSIAVNFDTNATTGNIFVYGNNICGNGPASPNFPVTVNPIPDAPIITSMGDTLVSNAATGNQWYFNDILLPGDTSQTWVAPYNGHYWDEVTLNGCASDTSNHVLIVLTGIISDPLSSLVVYPVPSDGRFNVILNTPFQKSFSVCVYNTLGINIFEETGLKPGNSLQYVIDLRQMPNGIYTMIFENNINQIVKKIVVSK
jgi:hypothetical protein